MGRLEEFDRILHAHEIQLLPNSIIADLVKTCEAVIADPDCQDFVAVSRKNGSRIKYKAMGLGGLRYVDESIV